MRRIVALLVVSGALGCAGAPVLPDVGVGFAPALPARPDAKRVLPTEPRARWHVAPNEQGAALELRF